MSQAGGRVVVGFDTATTATAVGVMVGTSPPLTAYHEPEAGQRPGHTTVVLELARELLERTGARWGDVDRLAVGTGPGTFTGLRIGVATARALTQSIAAEIVGVSTLWVLAHGAGARAKSPVLAAIDARRGETFVAAHSGGDALIGPLAVGPEQLVGLAERELPRLASAPWRAVGDGALRFRQQLESAGITVDPDGAPTHRPDAGVLCQLAAAAPGADREAVVPDYVRMPDAEIALLQRAPDDSMIDSER
ncbi:MAG TPA: tRNA (adenosine(37)-N6)-threonylcarbamoyltransferase complex dimerization subunit type 1 TsaB [Solirubrobacteraceae bacterium]|nr:tRNA (adenosine(37)-N6)-threonylcarbamoyltransferase complex dimerization subunit type 1 TsaB [Solirubrobacteraceae bacterium]